MQYFKGVPIEKIGYCKCRQQSAIFTENEEFGYWDVCCDCKKPLEDGFHYYNHYDGEDHDDLDLYNRLYIALISGERFNKGTATVYRSLSNKGE